MYLNIAKEFSETPGPRSRVEGTWSGDQFLEELLEPRYLEALQKQTTLTIDLDGVEGYATSFLEAAFGGLARKFDQASVLNTLTFSCNDEPFLIEEIKRYIRDARI